MKTYELVRCKRVLLLVSHCYVIPESENMPAVQHGAAVKRCVRSTEALGDIISGKKTDEGLLRRTNMVKTILLKIPSNNAFSV